MATSECSLITNGKTIAMGSRDHLVSYLKQCVPDGTYSIHGPGIDLAVHRAGGIVYPAGGRVDMELFPPRDLDEAKRAATA